ncbi:MAG: hypothetical protein GEU81_09070 [Nitriliruptorales bacterium]|nr:hypothetical protein [Nitriliruptorales bacterium]
MTRSPSSLAVAVAAGVTRIVYTSFLGAASDAGAVRGRFVLANALAGLAATLAHIAFALPRAGNRR